MTWVCAHCNTAAVVKEDDFSKASFDLKSGRHYFRYLIRGITCPNPHCAKVSIILRTDELANFAGTLAPISNTATFKSLIPSTEKERAKNYPDYIPASILSDYSEACAIVSLSPKASATLARRCLQGMIRDFWGVTNKPNLHQEILAIEDRVDPIVWQAILDVKSIGNIGAHMEKDINLIIDVSVDEAELLIEMVEMLLDDWYVARHEKHQKLQRIKDIAVEKAEARKR
ncbi:TPA: DUF4145 domain-containing protein [Enterobacter cloacae]|nr:DUF4145 domain-containing protein [Enterobacter cloacae]